ncbi:MAG: hypothetical protein ACI4XG_12680, partial [Bradyrhizobium sp.]
MAERFGLLTGIETAAQPRFPESSPAEIAAWALLTGAYPRWNVPVSVDRLPPPQTLKGKSLCPNQPPAPAPASP